MAQMHRYFVLLLILGFSCTYILGTKRPNEKKDDDSQDWEEVPQENRCGNSGSDNEAKYYKRCSSFDNGNASCQYEYYVVFGKTNERAKEIFQNEYGKPESDQAPVHVDILFPQAYDNTTKTLPINMIAVKDRSGSATVHEDEICIVEGGINEKFVKIVAKSNEIDGSNGYKVTISGVPDN